ncbi:MAG: hypothetical protein WCB46_05105 [Methanoregula sp.]
MGRSQSSGSVAGMVAGAQSGNIAFLAGATAAVAANGLNDGRRFP